MTLTGSQFEERDDAVSRKAAAAITDHVFANISSTETLVLTGAGGIADGVTAYAVDAVGDMATIYTDGAVFVKAGGTVTAGGDVVSDAAGKAVDATGSLRTLGYAETGATVADELVRVRLYKRAQGAGSAPVVAAITANGAVTVRPSRTLNITKAGVAAMTLAAPTTGTDDGVTLTFISQTANAHTITATGLLQTGSVSTDIATFAASIGANLVLRAYLAKWQVVSQIGITFS